MQQTADHAPRARLITNSPADEFASRPGATRPISDALASLILSRKETRKVIRGAVRVKMPGEPEARRYTSPDCLISQPVMEGKEIILAYNPLMPQRVHIFSEAGAYIETVPCELQAAWLQSDEESKRALADARRAMSRAETQLQELHREDTAQAVRRAQNNAAQMQRAVVTLPPPEPAEPAPRRQAVPLETRVTREMDRRAAALDTIRDYRQGRINQAAELAAKAQAALDGEGEY